MKIFVTAKLGVLFYLDKRKPVEYEKKEPCRVEVAGDYSRGIKKSRVAGDIKKSRVGRGEIIKMSLMVLMGLPQVVLISESLDYSAKISASLASSSCSSSKRPTMLPSASTMNLEGMYWMA